MSLIPYNRGSNAVILRHGAAIVTYDRQARQVSVIHDSSHAASDSALSRPEECPTCHRPLAGLAEGEEQRPTSGDRHEPSFLDPQYFRLLNRSLPSSNASTRSSSRQTSSRHSRSLVQRATEGEARVAGEAAYTIPESSTGTLRPPEDAEFVGSAPAPESTTQGISSQALSQGYFQKFFVPEKELGRGGKGVVFLVRHVLDDVFLGRFAVKRVPVGNDHEWLKKVLVEVQLLTNLTHPNLVQYKHVWLEDYQISKFGPSVPCAFILQQYCNMGDLHSFMLDSARSKVTPEEMKERMRRKSKGQLDPPETLLGPRRMNFDQIFSFFKDITAGLHHLHINNYIHRDLKPSNCLLHQSPSGPLKVLVSDFGEVQVVSARRSSTGSTGTISYCAPEVLRRDVTTGTLGNFTTKSDIFSLGMIVYFMCFGRLPYKSADQLEEENEDVEQLREEISTWAGFDDQEKQRTDLPDRLYKFLKRLLSIHFDERPSTDDILHSIGAGGDPEDLGSTQPRLHVFDDIRSRVQNIETPAPTPQRMPSERRNSQLPDLNIPDAGASRNMRFSRNRPTNLRRASPAKSPHRDEQTFGKNHTAYVEGDDESDTDVFSDAQMESSLTLRARKNSRTPHHNTPSPHSPGHSPRRLLLPPPPTFRSYLTDIFHDRQSRDMLKVVFFVVKAVTMLQPCAPYAPRTLVMYPLLALAALDFVYNDDHDRHRQEISDAWSGTRLSLLLLAMHMATVTTVGWWNGLCPMRSTSEGWD